MVSEKWVIGIVMAMLLMTTPACTVVTAVDESQLQPNNDFVYSSYYYGFRPYWQDPYHEDPL